MERHHEEMFQIAAEEIMKLYFTRIHHFSQRDEASPFDDGEYWMEVAKNE